MKKLLTIAFCAAAASVMAVDVEMGQVGLYNFTCPAGVNENLIAVCFDDLDTGAVNVSNLVNAAALDVGDELYIFGYNDVQDDVQAGYQGFTLDVNKAWQPIAVSVTVSSSGEQTIKTGSASEVSMTVGQGFWIVRKNPTADATVTVYGKPNTALTQTLVAGKRNLCGNPSGEAKFPTITGAAEGDTIMVPNASGNGFDTWTYKSSAWKKVPTQVATTIRANAGFWYISKGATAPVIKWTTAAAE